jgi:shikimate kinase
MGEGATVWLVGMMGAGKSAVGCELAHRLGRPFLDTDREIEALRGVSISEIFAREGEEAFRTLEREMVERLAGRAAVVALGGGALARPELRRIVGEVVTLVWLRARPETLLARIGACEARPLLSGLAADERLARIRALLAAREADYARAAVAVETDAATVGEVAERIERALAQREAAA